jgi:hypothetical protein
MGTACSWKLTADNTMGTDPFITETANSILLETGDDSKIEHFMWKRWSDETKWWAPDFVKKLSEKVDVVFRLEARGDEHFTWFFHKGNILSEEEVWERPQFPSRPLFKKRLEVARVKRVEAKRLQESTRAKAEQEKMKKELEALRQREQELLSKLKQKSA